MKKINRAGYTIVELMIVLAITGVIASGAFLLVRGQTEKNEFSQGVRDFETKLTDVANDVAKGYFPDVGGNRLCTVDNNGVHFSPHTSVSQGGNADCVFAGKMMFFNISGGDETQFSLRTLVVRRLTEDNKPVLSLDNLERGDIDIAPWLDESVPLRHGFRALSVKYNNAIGYDSLIFMTGFSNRPSDSSQLSGAPDTNLYWLGRTPPGQCNTGFPFASRTPQCYIAPSTDVGSDGVEICMEHGGGGRRVLFKVGQEGRKLSVTTEIDSTC